MTVSYGDDSGKGSVVSVVHMGIFKRARLERVCSVMWDKRNS